MPRRGHPCRCCAECDTACPRTSYRAIKLADGDFDPPHLPWNPSSIGSPYSWSAPECAWTIRDGTPAYYLWRWTPRAPAALAQLPLDDATLQPLTNPAAMAAIRAAVAAKNWNADQEKTFYDDLFLTPTTSPAPDVNTKALVAQTAPFHAVRDGNGLPQATFELRCLAGPFEPWSTTLDFGCDPTTGDDPAISVRITRQITPAAFTDHPSAVRFYDANGSLHCLAWLLELLDDQGETLHQTTLLDLPGDYGNLPNLHPPLASLHEYLRVAFKTDQEQNAHVAIYALGVRTATGLGFAANQPNDLVELFENAPSFGGILSNSVSHIFPPVPLGNDRGGRGIRSTQPVLVFLAPLRQGDEIASSFPPSATQACDPPPSATTFVAPHQQKTICDRRVYNGHVPSALEGTAFTKLLVHFGPEYTPANYPAIYTAAFLGLHELENISSTNAPLFDGTFYSATTPDTPFTDGFNNLAGFLRSLELSACLRVRPGYPCTQYPPETNWRPIFSLSLRAAYEFTGANAPPPRTLHATINWEPFDNASGVFPAPIYYDGHRVTRFLSGLPVAMIYSEGTLGGDADKRVGGGFTARQARTSPLHQHQLPYTFIQVQLVE